MYPLSGWKHYLISAPFLYFSRAYVLLRSQNNTPAWRESHQPPRETSERSQSTPRFFTCIFGDMSTDLLVTEKLGRKPRCKRQNFWTMACYQPGTLEMGVFISSNHPHLVYGTEGVKYGDVYRYTDSWAHGLFGAVSIDIGTYLECSPSTRCLCASSILVGFFFGGHRLNWIPSSKRPPLIPFPFKNVHTVFYRSAAQVWYWRRPGVSHPFGLVARDCPYYLYLWLDHPSEELTSRSVLKSLRNLRRISPSILMKNPAFWRYGSNILCLPYDPFR